MSNLASAVAKAAAKHQPTPTGTTAGGEPPFITSAVNGLVVPLLPHQGGILHRFKRPGNTIVVDTVHGASVPDDVGGRPLVMNSEHPDPGSAEADAASRAAMQAELNKTQAPQVPQTPLI